MFFLGDSANLIPKLKGGRGTVCPGRWGMAGGCGYRVERDWRHRMYRMYLICLICGSAGFSLAPLAFPAAALQRGEQGRRRPEARAAAGRGEAICKNIFKVEVLN